MAVVIFLILMCVALNSPTAGLRPPDRPVIPFPEIYPDIPFLPLPCPRGWIESDDRCCKIFTTPKSWNEAQADCKNKGVNLISVRNRDDLLIVQHIMGLKGLNSVWVGGTDAVTEGQWQWSDGEPFSWTFWSPGEPDNIRQEDCMSVDIGGNASDWQCYMKQPYICYKELQF